MVVLQEKNYDYSGHIQDNHKIPISFQKIRVGWAVAVDDVLDSLPMFL